MEILQIQGMFAPFVGVLAGTALLLVWRNARGVHYLPYFAFSLFFFAAGFVFSQLVFEKMTFPNAVSSSLMYFASSGLIVHAAMSRLEKKINMNVHLGLMALDILGRSLILQLELSASIYLIYANGMMGMPMLIGGVFLLRNESRDIQSVFLGIAFSLIAAMAILAPAMVLSIGEDLGPQNYFSSYYWVLLSFLTIFGICLLIFSFGFTIGSDLLRMTEAKEAKDFLSGLLTRRAFDKDANELINTHTGDKEHIGCIMCDIDHFKQINDDFGHDAGDNVIASVGKLISESAPNGAIAGRIGGEEFCIIIPGQDIRGARLFAEALRTAISTIEINGLPRGKHISASFGVTVFEAHEQLSSMCKRADKALYKAKNTGRDRVVCSLKGMSETSGSHHSLGV